MMNNVSLTLILLLLLRDLLISWPFACSTGQLKPDGGSSESIRTHLWQSHVDVWRRGTSAASSQLSRPPLSIRFSKLVSRHAESLQCIT